MLLSSLVIACCCAVCFESHFYKIDSSVSPTASPEVSNKTAPKEKDNDLLTPKSISSTNVVKGQLYSFYFQYPGQAIWLKYYADATEYIRLNYTGPSASLSQFFTFDSQPNSYLTQTSNVNNSPDCYLVSINREYYFKFSSSAGGSLWSVRLESINSNPENYKKTVLHQTFDLASPFGYRYCVEDYSYLSDTASSPSSATFINHNISPYFYGIDTTHYCYKKGAYENGSINNSWSDNRRAVQDTQCSEFSSIAYAEDEFDYRPLTVSGARLNEGSIYFRSSSVFLSQTAVATCAHTFYNEIKPEENTTNLTDGSLPKRKLFFPGGNSYGCTEGGAVFPFGIYQTVNAYVSVSFLVSVQSFGSYQLPSSKYDWAICETVPLGSDYPPHSTMGITAFTFNESFSYARFSGYGKIYYGCDNDNQYSMLQWAETGNKTVSIMDAKDNNQNLLGTYLGSTEITNSKGHSGGPLYYSAATIINGQVHYECLLIGITSGSMTFGPLPNDPYGIDYYYSAAFYQMDHFFVNMVRETLL